MNAAKIFPVIASSIKGAEVVRHPRSAPDGSPGRELTMPWCESPAIYHLAMQANAMAAEEVS
jgi:hypothetical protein